MLNSVAIIPARGGSKGVPRKNLADLGDGRPLIAWTIKAALDADVFDAVYVSTEDAEIATVAIQYGAQVLSRDSMYSQDHIQLDEVMLYCLRQLELMGAGPAAIALIQPTTPFISADDIRGAAGMYDFGFDYTDDGTVFTACRDPKYHWVQSADTDNDETFAVPIHHNPAKRLGRQWTDDDDRMLWENGALYILPAKRLSLERTVRLPPFLIYEMPEERSLEIDTPLDLLIARAYVADTKSRAAK